MSDFITEALQQLQPVIGLLVGILIVAVIYLWRALVGKDAEIERLRQERNTVIADKDKELQSIVVSKDNDLKQLTEKVFEIQKETLASNNMVANNIAANTEVTKNMSRLIENINTILISSKK